MIYIIGNLLLTILQIISFLVFASIILSLLLHFEILNRRSAVVVKIEDFLLRVTEPFYRPIRKYVPSFNSIDLSPMILLLAIQFLENIIAYGMRASMGPLVLGG